MIDERPPDRPPGPDESPTIPSDSPSSDFDSVSRHGRFVPGTRLGKRYRIVSLLGSGGMGEVYRADDLELGESVALKFLPAALANDEKALAHLKGEVRIARQISHPNICRVYDIGEAEGHHFLAMEYVDGEDLASVLRRMGRPTQEKALDMARQICAGLGAAHERGVLHRDLKPANIMLDGRGRVRIMDFGLAGLAEELRREKKIAGTIEYMAPEQLSGEGVDYRSDVYSLGLVLYELFTGKRTYAARSVTDLKKLHESGPPSSLSAIIEGIDPLVERTVLRCLERDRAMRPSSAMEVAAALPGGDPLQAAIAAGETPSPEMVAAAGGHGGLRPGVGWALVASLLVGLLLVSITGKRTHLVRIAPPEKPPAVMAHDARAMLERIGDRERLRRFAWELEENPLFLTHVAKTDSLPGRWVRAKDVRPGPYRFWYRESPTAFFPLHRWTNRTRIDRPPMDQHGMLLVVLDSGGRLLEYQRVDRVAGDSIPEAADWPLFFELAGLDTTSFVRSAPERLPLLPADQWLSWKGPSPDAPAETLQVEAGSFQGQPVYFRVLYPFESLLLKTPALGGGGERGGSQQDFSTVVATAGAVLLFLLLAVVLFLLFIAQRNIRKGRGDRSGAIRTGAAATVLAFLHYGMSAGLKFPLNVVLMFGQGLPLALLFGAFIGLSYLALEPYIRRYWPEVLVSWTRLIHGRFRNPLVGRDLLVGLVAGVLGVLMQFSQPLLSRLSGIPMDNPSNLVDTVYMNGLSGLADLFSIWFLFSAILGAGLLLVALLIFRRKWIAVSAAASLWICMEVAGTMVAHQGALPLTSIPSFLVIPLLFLLASRYGFLAALSALFVLQRLSVYPVVLGTTEWYAGRSWVVVGVLIALALYAFRIATARWPGSRKAQGSL